MDRYWSVRKPTTTSISDDHLKLPVASDGNKPFSATITRHLLDTLSDSSNPITHSNIHDRSDIVVSATTGHQRGEGRGTHCGAHLESRSKKLSLQRGDEFHRRGILSGVRAHINGYLGGTTDTEMKRIITQAGGTTLLTPSGATHIVTSRQLNGSKTHRILTKKSRHPLHVVRPEWITDSIAAGRRLNECRYTLTKSSWTRNLVDTIKSSPKGSSTS